MQRAPGKINAHYTLRHLNIIIIIIIAIIRSFVNYYNYYYHHSINHNYLHHSLSLHVSLCMLAVWLVSTAEFYTHLSHLM